MLEMSSCEDDELLSWAGFGSFHELFIDDEGRIITFCGRGMRYEHLIFVDNRVEFHSIPVSDYSSDWRTWSDHHLQISRPIPYHAYHIWIDLWTHHNPTIFKTDIQITPLHPFTDLGLEMLAYLRYTRQ